MTAFSFHPVKHITTGEGGMVTTHDAAPWRKPFDAFAITASTATRASARPRGSGTTRWCCSVSTTGSPILRAPSVSSNWESWMRILRAGGKLRRVTRRAYSRNSQESCWSRRFRPEANPAWHLYPIRIDGEKFRTGLTVGANRGEIFRALRAENIGVNVHYIPIHHHPYYRERFGYKGGEYPVAEGAYERLISLPMFHSMSDQDVDDVIRAVDKVFSHFVASLRQAV